MGPWVHVARVGVRGRTLLLALVAVLALVAAVLATRAKATPSARVICALTIPSPAPPRVADVNGCLTALTEYEQARRTADDTRIARANAAVEACLDRSVSGGEP